MDGHNEAKTKHQQNKIQNIWLQDPTLEDIHNTINHQKWYNTDGPWC